MLALASVLLSVAAVAFWSLRLRSLPGAATALLAFGACVRAWGVTEGSLVLLVLLMAAASALVLVLPPRAAWTPKLASASALLGAVVAAWGMWS